MNYKLNPRFNFDWVWINCRRQFWDLLLWSVRKIVFLIDGRNLLNSGPSFPSLLVDLLGMFILNFYFCSCISAVEIASCSLCGTLTSHILKFKIKSCLQDSTSLCCWCCCCNCSFLERWWQQRWENLWAWWARYLYLARAGLFFCELPCYCFTKF